MMIQGLTPGPAMLSTHLDVTFTLVWSIAIANIFGTTLCLLSTNILAKISLVRIHLLVPLITAMVFLAAFQASRHYGDLWSLLIFALLGWFMKRFGWPRPPIILGLVLSTILENNLNIAMTRYGFEMFSRPIFIGIIIIIVASLYYGIRMVRKPESDRAEESPRGPVKFRFQASGVFTLVMVGIFGTAVFTAGQWQFEIARVFPWAIGIPALLLCLSQLYLDLFRPTEVGKSGFMDLPVDHTVPVSVVIRRASNIFGWIIGLFLGTWLVGLIVIVPVFIVLYLSLQAREKWWVILAYTLGMIVFMIGVFHLVLTVPWPEALFPQLEQAILANF
jgi:hypothetical protein